MDSQHSHTYVYYFHILILPIFIYVGFVKSKSPDWMFSLLLGIGVLGLLYHLFKIIDMEIKTASKKTNDSSDHNHSSNHKH